MFDNYERKGRLIDFPSLFKERYTELSDIRSMISQISDSVLNTYINLKIVTRKSYKNKETQFANQNAVEVSPSQGQREFQLQSYASLYGEDELEQQEDIDVEKIFNPNSVSKTTRTIAIYGRAGVGKSTLCQYLAVKWKEDQLWQNKFNAIIWLPLRDILDVEAKADEGDYLAEIVRNKCLRGFGDDKPSTRETRNYLFSEQNRGKILIILDGYDEIAHSMTRELEKLLAAILSSPRYYVILTSRPIVINLNKRLAKFDRELENVGFTKENIQNYVKKLYPITHNELLQFIESNTQLKNIAHIPLNLDLICSVWDPTKANQPAYTVSQLYQDIIERLFECMHEKGIFLQDLSKPQLEARQKIFMEILGDIAFTGMTSKKSIINSDTVKEIIESKEKELKIYTLFEELLAMGIIKALSVNKNPRDNDVHFIHHTFQEYFAAFKLAKGFEYFREDEEFETSVNKLRRYKYVPYYEMMWISIVGILYTRCSKVDDYLPLLQFWDEFENEPRELLGIRHEALRRKFLEECPPLEHHPKTLKELKEILADTNHVLSELIKVIDSKAPPKKMLDAINGIIELGIINENVESKLENIILESHDYPGVKLYAAEALLTLGYNSNKKPENLNIVLNPLVNEFHQNLLPNRENAIIRIYKAPKIDPNIKGILKERYTKILSNKDLQVTPINLRDPELLRAIERNMKELFYSNGGYICRKSFLFSLTSIIPLSVFFGRVFAGSPHYKAEIPVMATTAIVGIGVTGIISGAVIGSANTVRTVVNKKTSNLFPLLTKELDEIALSGGKDEDIFKAICSKSQNNIIKIMAWSSNGVLNLALTISLYSFSSRQTWLAPLENITFIYKDPTVLLTLYNDLIMQGDKRLTKNENETKTVLGIMRKTYERAKISTAMLDQYLSGSRLSIISAEERLDLTRRIRTNRPLGLTSLHKAARDGNLDAVIEFVGQKIIDINHFDNQDCDTPLILAIKNATTDKHWEVIEYLVENKADVNIGGAVFKMMALIKQNHLNKAFLLRINSLMLRMVRQSCFVNESLIEKILRFAIDDYKLQRSVIDKDRVFERLSILITGEGRDWMKDSSLCDEYLMYLSNSKLIVRDGTEELKPQGSPAEEALLMRLHTYLTLHVKLCAGEINSLPKLSTGEFLNFEETKKALLSEIKVLIQTWIFCKAMSFLIKFSFNQNLIKLEDQIELTYAKAITECLNKLEKGKEFIVLASKLGSGHCIYAALHKLEDDTILVRIDNRYLFFNNSLQHERSPYVLTQIVENKFNIILETEQEVIKEQKILLKVKPFCSNIFQLKGNNESLVSYIKDLFCLSVDDNFREKHIYDNSIKFKDLPEEALNQVNIWPYHLVQEVGTNNCTLSSYNLGISARHGMEFFEWLIGKEQQLAPPFSSIHQASKVNENSRWN
ncbi:MAG: lyase domain protein repeat-containing protein [Candidatus Midichloriaceae bacterium]|jgi:deoxyadenosine/deoxycytidine kinase|nr:lyase domain protein repeat-containing protein [Candidatus Midichloriaceae bacterium]